MHVTNRQLFFIIFLRIIAGSAVELPAIMAKSSGTGTWITLLVASFITVVPVVIIVYLGNSFKEKTLFEYSQLLVGKFVTNCFSLIYAFYFFSIIFLLARSTAEKIKAEILLKTPIWATVLILLFVSGYAASKGLTNIGRIFEYLGVLIIGAILFIHTLMLFYGDILNIQPFFDTAEIGKYASGLPTTIFLFIGFEVITIIPFSKSSNKKAIRTSIISVLFSGVSYIFIAETSFIVLGIEDVSNYDYPLFNAIRSLDIDILQFLKRIDIIFLVAWLFSLFCSLTMVIFAVNEYMRKVFYRANGNILLIIICILAFVVSLILPSNYEVTKLHQFLTTYFGLVPAFIIPLFLLIIAKVKKKCGKQLIKF